MKRKLLKTFFLCLATAIFLSGMTFSAMATTYPADQGRQEALELQNLGLLKGVNANGDLAIEATLTRAEALTLIQRICNIADEDNQNTPGFQDIKGHWAYEKICLFYNNGYINGTSDTTFEPNRNITTAEFLKILLSCMGYQDLNLDSAYAKGIDLELLTGLGITADNNHEENGVGVSTGSLKNDPLTRGQTASISARALFAPQKNGQVLYEKLIQDGLFTDKEQFSDLKAIIDGEFVATPTYFADALNAYMPNDQNYMISPFSIKIALAMAANGAAGETQSEILKVLGIKNLDNYNQYIKNIMAIYDKAQVSQFEIANSVWQNASFARSDYQPDFLTTMADFYNAEIGVVNNENMLSEINGWVSEKTNDKIKNIINESAVNNSEYQNLLINAIYFKGAWKNTFSKNNTQANTFTNYDKTTSTADFMNQTDYFSYGKYADIQIIKMPYSKINYNTETYQTIKDTDIDLNMYILLGDQQITNPEQILDNVNLNNKYVQLSLPKFKVEYENEMSKALNDLGIKKAFSFSKADLSNMLQYSDQKAITRVLHKTYIAIDEKGTEAAAVTSITEGSTSEPIDSPVIMKVDHPFTYIIRDDASGEVIFIGQINKMQ